MTSNMLLREIAGEEGKQLQFNILDASASYFSRG